MIESCGMCKGLIDMVEGGFATCIDFCNSVGRTCIHAIVSEDDDCVEESYSNCPIRWSLSRGIICECGETLLSGNDTSLRAACVFLMFIENLRHKFHQYRPEKPFGHPSFLFYCRWL